MIMGLDTIALFVAVATAIMYLTWLFIADYYDRKLDREIRKIGFRLTQDGRIERDNKESDR